MRFTVTVKMREDAGEAPAALQEAMSRGMQEMFASEEMVDAVGLGSRWPWASRFGWPAVSSP